MVVKNTTERVLRIATERERRKAAIKSGYLAAEELL
jgi:hypothetical protein